jgi:phospholipid/cholesterol/gamma-HCH transport system permease protein
MFLGLLGGLIACVSFNLVSAQVYIEGIQAWFEPYTIFYALIKTVVFAVIIVSAAAYYGYNIKGGALDVGNASTKAVVNSSIWIILFNLLLTELLL